MIRMQTALVAVLLCLLVSVLSADVVQMTDGRRYEGEIVAQSDTSIRIDTVVGTIRATMTLVREEIKTIEKKPLPSGFYDPPPAAPRVSKAESFAPGDNLYLEVPVKGQFGKDVCAEGIRKVIAYASRHRVPHVVFVIDSEGFHDIDEAGAVFRILEKTHSTTQYHAVVSACTGDALAVAMLCDTINLIPGGKIGGAPEKLSETSKRFKAEEEHIVRRQIARDAFALMRKRGNPGVLVRAMIDSNEELAGWLDDKGKVSYGTTAPAGVPAERLLFHSKAGELLVLTAEQVSKAGSTPLVDGTAGMGKKLNLGAWRLESDYGARAMADSAVIRRKRLATKAAATEKAIQQNVTRRETIDRALQHAVQEAAKWDPSNASYQTYARRWRRGWGWHRDYSDYSDRSTTYTQESRKKWQERTDISMKYLKQAANAAVAMQRLDKEAVTLGLQPTYKTGELAVFKNDLEVKYNNLRSNRKKRGE